MRALLAFLLLVAGASGAVPQKPNVIVFLIDDLGYTDLGCYGSSLYETPRLDALAAAGVRMTDFYSANPVCSPTRASLQTGKAPQRMGLTQWLNQPNEKHLPLEEFTVAEAFAEAGYATGYMGKWHLGHEAAHQPEHQGYAWTKGVNLAGAPASYHFPYQRGQQGGKRPNWHDVPDLEDGEEGDYLTDRLTDHALTFIKDRAAGERLFFLCYGHYAVHTPIQPPAELHEKYEAKVRELYGESETPKVTSRYESIGRGRQDNAAFAAMVENLDQNIGRVLDQLDDLGIRDSTLVVFTSDNGGLCTRPMSKGKGKRMGPTSNLPLRDGKGWTYEGGTRIATIFSWPGTLEEAVVDTPGITMDLYPTLLELAGLPSRPEQHQDGLSLVSALQGEPSAELKERFLAWTYPHDHGSGHKPSRAIRKGVWKLVHSDRDGVSELYHLGNDLGERNDLSGMHPEKVALLKKELDDWIEATTLAESK